MSPATVSEYTQAMIEKKGFDPFPPVEVIQVNGRYIILDGHHRTAAAINAGIRVVPIIVVNIEPIVAAGMEAEVAIAAAEQAAQWK